MISPPNFTLESKNFLEAWETAVRFCMENGYVDGSDTGFKTKDMCSFIVLTGRAIQQIKLRQLHSGFPTKGLHLQEYINQFTDDFDVKSSEFIYTYFHRLSQYPTTVDYSDLVLKDTINQLHIMKQNLRIGSRRNQAITWIPIEDIDSPEPPCLQRVWIRVLEEPDYEHGIKKKGQVELHITWRSRDMFSAWMSNIIGIVFMVYNEVLGDDYEIVKLVDFVDSAHINENDWESAGRV